jgi:hypothetical protein
MTVALAGIAESADHGAFISSLWFEPFGLDGAAVIKSVLPGALSKAVPAIGSSANNTMIPYALPPGEPDGTLWTWPSARSGLAMLVTKDEAGQALSGLWPFTSEGAEQEIAIERILLAPDRLQAIVEGTIGDALQVAWLDVLFAVDRAFYAKGSVHKVLLAGIAHDFSVGAVPPIHVTPGAPSYDVLRALNPKAVGPDGTITFRTDGLAAILPVEKAPPAFYKIQGPVKRIRNHGEILGREVSDIRVTVARLGEDVDRDIDLAIMVSDLVLGGRPLPQVGDNVSATIRLQGRIWWPNVRRV